MRNIGEWTEQYSRIPSELRQIDHWVCYKKIEREGFISKTPISPVKNGDTLENALPNSSEDWSDFNKALSFCHANELDGLGFELGMSSIVVISLKNRSGMPQNEYQEMVNNFVSKIDSYTEWSASGNGIHIFCYVESELPESVENRNIKFHRGEEFMAVTGNSVGRRGMRNADKAISECLSLYSSSKVEKEPERRENESKNESKSLSDLEFVDGIKNGKNGAKFKKLMSGDWSDYDSESSARQALCNFLAYYSQCDRERIKRIYSMSPLSLMGATDTMVQNAIDKCLAYTIDRKDGAKAKVEVERIQNGMNIGDDGEPIFKIDENMRGKKKSYTLDDTGNAQRFYDYYGIHFKWNSSDKMFMFWTGKTWKLDVNDVIRKYANELVKTLRNEADEWAEKAKEATDEAKKNKYTKIAMACEKNVKRVANKSGKDAMLFEIRSMGNMPVEEVSLDTNPYLLNTDSGIVDLRTGEIKPFDRNELMSRNTNTKVSYDEPKQFLDFLRSIFYRGNSDKEKAETEEIVEFMQRSLGYTITGLTDEQCIFILCGDGSNGKSTLSSVLQAVFGDYFGAIDSSQLMASKSNNNASRQYSLAELRGIRYLSTQETDEGDRLQESMIKQISGGTDPINAQRKFGRPFFFIPIFKMWMSTNNLPQIRGTDFGIWRRIRLIMMKRQFTDKDKDVEMPRKLKEEYPQILGWFIQGAMKYISEKTLKYPKCLEDEVTSYKTDSDIVYQFVSDQCNKNPLSLIKKTEMYKKYKEWSLTNMGWALSEAKFRDKMIKKGYVLDMNKNGEKCYKGLVFKDEDMRIKYRTITKEDVIDDDDF